MSNVKFPPDVNQGVLKSVAITMPGAGTVCVITLPDTATGLRLFPNTNPVRFAIGEDPAAVGAPGAAAAIAATAFTVGSIAKEDQWETRILPPGAGRTLRLLSLVNAAVIEVDTF